MFTTFRNQFKPACLMFLWLSVVTGLAYPLVVMALGTGLYPVEARGSLIKKDGVVVGSRLVGQPFASDRYFRGRPSATAPFPDNAAASSGSNLGPSNPALREIVAARAAKIQSESGNAPTPMDLVTASGSGLDPHISPEAAAYQIDRVARARGLSKETVADLVGKNSQGRLWGFWGEPRVNVLALNLALDAASASR